MFLIKSGGKRGLFLTKSGGIRKGRRHPGKDAPRPAFVRSCFAAVPMLPGSCSAPERNSDGTAAKQVRHKGREDAEGAQPKPPAFQAFPLYSRRGMTGTAHAFPAPALLRVPEPS